jgi:hypothetical protein
MSFIRTAWKRGRSRPAAPPWTGYADAEAFAFDLCQRGTPTDQAIGLLRQSRYHFLRQQQAAEASERRREGVNFRRQAMRDGWAAASRKLLVQSGYIPEEEPDPAAFGTYYGEQRVDRWGPWDG